MPSKKHEDAAKQIAKKLGTEYNPGKGADVVSSKAVVEVETADSAKDGIRQLQGYQRPVYIAGTDQKAIDAALKATKGTTIGVMDKEGNIIKGSSRKRKKK